MNLYLPNEDQRDANENDSVSNVTKHDAEKKRKSDRGQKRRIEVVNCRNAGKIHHGLNAGGEGVRPNACWGCEFDGGGCGVCGKGRVIDEGEGISGGVWENVKGV